MPKREKFETNQYYHIYNRGLRKKTLFRVYTDFEKFLGYIDKYNEKYSKSMQIIAYCLLPNHFHFVIHNKKEGHDISYFIGNLCAAYTRYYKGKYGAERGTSYFEARFRIKHLHDEGYLQQCIRYVENNAIKHDVASYDDEVWPFASACSLNCHPGEKGLEDASEFDF